jgi:hypothetical protein
VYIAGKKPFPQRPERVAKRNYYYCHQEEEKRQFAAEHGLQTLEDIALPILRRLAAREFRLNPDDRLTFAGYVATAHTRVPTFEKFLDHTATLLEAKRLELLAHNKQALESVVAKLGERTGEKIDVEDFREKLTGGSIVLQQVNRGWTVKQMFQNMLLLQEVIFSMRWTFLLAGPDDDGFLTSDNPVSLFDPVGNPFGGIGFKSSPAAHFTFPISRGVCLLAQHLLGPETRQLNASEVRMVNKGTITRADSQLYAPFSSLSVQGILNDVVKRKGGPRKVLFSKGRALVELKDSK